VNREHSPPVDWTLVPDNDKDNGGSNGLMPQHLRLPVNDKQAKDFWKSLFRDAERCVTTLNDSHPSR